jgi:hypothetical protein
MEVMGITSGDQKELIGLIPMYQILELLLIYI